MQRCIAVALFLFASLTEPDAADLAFERAVDAALASPIVPADVVDRAQAHCSTALCFANALASALPENVRLEPVDHPDTDSIRRVTTKPSVTARNNGKTLQLNITHFGRKSVAELHKVLTSTGENIGLELDLAGNAGGDFERMLEIAGLLLGSRRDAIEIDHGDHIERRSLEGPTTPLLQITRVEIDEKTASAALILARLLEAGGGGELIGPDLDGPVFLKHRIPIDHDWRLILPVATVRATARH